MTMKLLSYPYPLGTVPLSNIEARVGDIFRGSMLRLVQLL